MTLQCKGPAWATALRAARDDGHFLDVTLKTEGAEIRAHKNVLVAFSPYFHALLTSGLSESSQDAVEISDVDDNSLAAVVGCFYTGTISTTLAGVCQLIRTANLLQVPAIEEAAASFFAERLQPSTALEALGGFATEMAVGPSGCALQQKCLDYIFAQFPACAAEPAFLALADPALVAKILQSDALMVKTEEEVLTAVRRWVIHDEAARSAALEQLLPLIRFPQLSAPSQLGVYADPLLLKLMAQPGGAAIAGQLLKECSAAFAETAEFQQCARGKRREGHAHPRRVSPIESAIRCRLREYPRAGRPGARREDPTERRADGQNRGGGPDGRAPLGDTRRGWDRIILRRAIL